MFRIGHRVRLTTSCLSTEVIDQLNDEDIQKVINQLNSESSESDIDKAGPSEKYQMLLATKEA